jgi:hypothetical protein
VLDGDDTVQDGVHDIAQKRLLVDQVVEVHGSNPPV